MLDLLPMYHLHVLTKKLEQAGLQLIAARTCALAQMTHWVLWASLGSLDPTHITLTKHCPHSNRVGEAIITPPDIFIPTLKYFGVVMILF